MSSSFAHSVGWSLRLVRRRLTDAATGHDARVFRDRRAWFPILVLALTVAQLAVAAFVPGIERFADKAFGARLVFYPLLMLLVPALWWLAARRRGDGGPVPYAAFGLVMLPFLIDTTGNSLDLFDALVWWDDANHFFNWVLLCSGVGLIVCRRVTPRWAVVAVVAGLGAVLAIAWELGEWLTFIRQGTEIETAYEDTLGDLALGTFGGVVAGLIVAASVARRARAVGTSRVASHQ